MKQPLPFALALLVLLATSASTAAQAPPIRVGVMQVAGKNAFLNGRPVRAGEPVPINDGDYVSTGADTSVRIGLTADGYGGIIQLDQNTDPNLIVAARCIVMRMLKGQALVNAKNICLGTTNISGVTRSVVNLKADEGGGAIVTVIEGQLEVEKPEPMTVKSSERMVLLPDGTLHRYAIDAAEARRSVEWTQRYDFAKPASAGQGTHGGGWKVWAPILSGAAVLCATGVICEHGHDHGHDDSSEGSGEQPAQSVACCTYGDGIPSVMQTTARECADRGGSAYPTPQAAARACKAPPTDSTPAGATPTDSAPTDYTPPVTVRCCKYNDGSPYPAETTVQECSGAQDWVIKPGTEGQCSAVR